jgi:predicted RNase H-like HicB family nuclease
VGDRKGRNEKWCTEVIVEPKNGGYVAFPYGFYSLNGWGNTEEEALANLDEHIRFTFMWESGRPRWSGPMQQRR